MNANASCLVLANTNAKRSQIALANENDSPISVLVFEMPTLSSVSD